jgi:ankyrin repeat protein
LGLLKSTNDSIIADSTTEDTTRVESLIKLIKAGNVAQFKNEVKELVSKDFSLNTPTKGGWTCLHYAAYMGRSTMINELLTT